MTEMFTSLANDINVQIQEAKFIPNSAAGRNPHQDIVTKSKFLKTKDKRKNLKSNKRK